MKRVTFLILTMFMMVSTTEATNGINFPNYNRGFYAYNNAVNFIERGIEFYVFPNGEFDFYPLHVSRRNLGFLDIRRNFFGQIRRIENVNIRYDAFGNVRRIGDIFLRYRRGRLVEVGNLNIRYNRWGDPIFRGAVRDQFFFDNGVRFNLNIGVIYDFNDGFFSRNNFRRNYRQIREDRNFYYYRANPGVNVNDNNRIIRRRKANISRRNETIRNRRQGAARSGNNFSYRRSNDSRNNENTNATTRRNRNNTGNSSIEKRERRRSSVNTVRQSDRNNSRERARSSQSSVKREPSASRTKRIERSRKTATNRRGNQANDRNRRNE